MSKETFAQQCLFEIIRETERLYTVQWLEEKYCQEGRKVVFKNSDKEWTLTKAYTIKMPTKYVRTASLRKTDD